jgi:SusD family
MKKLYVFIFIVIASTFSACFKDLDTVPLDPNITTSGTAFKDEAVYKQFLGKLYAGLAVSGQEGPSGQPDIQGIDEGFGQYLRGFWYHQELPTDEALIGWNDQTIYDFHDLDWTASDGFTFAFYSRVFYQIVVCNEFLRETTDAKLNERNVSSPVRAEIVDYRAEARFLRALSYWHALDVFRNVPFVTENDKVGAFFPNQIKAPELFKYIESELLAIENTIKAPRTNQYGRADRAAVWTLLAKLYLNAETYIGQKKYNECLSVCEKVINAGYSLEPQYSHMFLADNHKSNEMIFPVAFDGINTRTWGGMTFIIRAGIGGSINPLASGVSGGWGGSRTTRQFVEKFPADLTGVVVDFNPGANLAKIFVASTSNNFSNEDATSTLASKPGQNGIFEGYKYFNANDEFVLYRFTNKFGDNGADGTLESGGANIKIMTSGLYFIRANLVNNTYVLEKRDWNIVGSAVPGGEAPLVWDADLKMLRIKTEFNIGSFILRANGNDMLKLGDPQLDGILNEGAGGINITKSGAHDLIVDLSRPDYTYQLKFTSFDKRGIFGTEGQILDINTIKDIPVFNNGYAVLKFKNITSTGQTGSNVDFPDTDFPMFRLADVYLMAAEAILRGANGSKATAVQYVNTVRERAYTGSAGNITESELTFDFLLDERGRELYWECHRRTDLVRFNKLTTGDYLWAWKGGVSQGQAVDARFNIFPIPAADISANPNLEQNPGYN